jgi:hypothetical protein
MVVNGGSLGAVARRATADAHFTTGAECPGPLIHMVGEQAKHRIEMRVIFK